MKTEKTVKKASSILICIVLMVLFVLISTSCGKENPSNDPVESQTESRSESSKEPVESKPESVATKPATPKPATPKPATPKPATPKPATPKPVKGVEKFVSSPNNDTSTMYSRDERVFSFLAYPSGRTEDDFTIDYNWPEYLSVSDINLVDKDDATEITFKITLDPSILEKSSDTLSMITLESSDGRVSSEELCFKMQGTEISDAEPLTLKINEPQIATFKVVPASLPLEELQIGMNAYVSNLKAEIIDSEIDEENNCQYVHVEILANGKHNGMSSGSVNLNDIYQYRGGTCDLTIVE